MATIGDRAHLAGEALRLKKAYLLSNAWAGRVPKAGELDIPTFTTWEKPRLRRYIADIRADLGQFLPFIVRRQSHGDAPFGLLAWLSEVFDRWTSQGGGLMYLGTAKDFEERFGELAFRDHGEVPPYTELLLQGWFGLAYRHPEYMLAKDLALLYPLYQQADYQLIKVDGQNPPEWAKKGSESHQALARAVVQCCFNLLESFVSGIARAAVMDRRFNEEDAAKLVDDAGPLRRRFILVTRALTDGTLELDDRNEDFKVLFSDIKKRRDAFVHCAPGPDPDSRGIVKEQLFHDVSKPLVDQAVVRTERLMRTIWTAVHKTDGPRWLPHFETGVHPPHGFRLVPA